MLFVSFRKQTKCKGPKTHEFWEVTGRNNNKNCCNAQHMLVALYKVCIIKLYECVMLCWYLQAKFEYRLLLLYKYLVWKDCVLVLLVYSRRRREMFCGESKEIFLLIFQVSSRISLRNVFVVYWWISIW